MNRFQDWLHEFRRRSPRRAAALALVVFTLVVIAVLLAAGRGGTTALANPAGAAAYAPPWRLFGLLGLLLIGAWLLGLRPGWAQILAGAVLGLCVSWALRPYEPSPDNEIVAAMRSTGVYYAQVGDIVGWAALVASGTGIIMAAATLLAPGATHDALHQMAGKARDALAGSVALPVVVSAFVLAVFSSGAWQAMSQAQSPSIAGLVVALLLSAVWILNRSTPQPWWLVTVVVAVIFVTFTFMFLLLTSLLVQPQVSLSWIDVPLPTGVAAMESARIRLATVFAAVALLAMIDSDRFRVIRTRAQQNSEPDQM